MASLTTWLRTQSGNFSVIVKKFNDPFSHSLILSMWITRLLLLLLITWYNITYLKNIIISESEAGSGAWFACILSGSSRAELMFSSFTCSATCSRVAIHQQEIEWRGGFSLLPRLPLPPSPMLCRLLSKPHTNFGPRGRIVACLSEASSEGQDEQRSAVSSALEESMPIKDLITVAACAVGLLTGIGVVLFNYAVRYHLLGNQKKNFSAFLSLYLCRNVLYINTLY